MSAQDTAPAKTPSVFAKYNTFLTQSQTWRDRLHKTI